MLQDLQWQRVLARDARFDGAFVYAVRSTGIYCRPSCPSRRPKRELVEFFVRPEAAERAGFRACQRCRPQSAQLDTRVEKMLRACRMLESESETMPRLEQLARAVALSPHHLLRTFQQVVGVTPRQYADALRLQRFKHQLGHARNVADATYGAGYGSSSRIYEKAAAQLGMTPLQFRQGGRGLTIRFTTAECELGAVLLAATERGVCAIKLGNSAAELELALCAEFPNAKLCRDTVALRPWLEQVLEHISGSQPSLKLPLHIRATAFQRRVWEELQRIPYGETASYAEIARRIRQPRAARAVARACASNPVCLAIPCHRVIQKGGNAGGYRWGAQRKQALLARERQAAESTPRTDP